MACEDYEVKQTVLINNMIAEARKTRDINAVACDQLVDMITKHPIDEYFNAINYPRYAPGTLFLRTKYTREEEQRVNDMTAAIELNRTKFNQNHTACQKERGLVKPPTIGSKASTSSDAGETDPGSSKKTATSTYILIGLGVTAIGLVVYLFTKKK